jgi:hypothetical protein
VTGDFACGGFNLGQEMLDQRADRACNQTQNDAPEPGHFVTGGLGSGIQWEGIANERDGCMPRLSAQSGELRKQNAVSFTRRRFEPNIVFGTLGTGSIGCHSLMRRPRK